MIRQLFLWCTAALLLAGAIFAVAASAYKVTLPSDLLVGGTKLKSGDYAVSVQGKQAIFKKGSQTFQIPVDVEKADQKFKQTTLELDGTTVNKINLAGTDTILVFVPQH